MGVVSSNSMENGNSRTQPISELLIAKDFSNCTSSYNKRGCYSTGAHGNSMCDSKSKRLFNASYDIFSENN